MRVVKMDNHWIHTFPIILKMTHYLRDFATSLESPLLSASLPTALLQASYLSLPLLSSALLAFLYPYLSQHRLARSLNSYLFTFNSALHLLAAVSMAYLAPSYMTDYVVGEDTSFDSDLEIVSSILYVPILSMLLPGSSVLTYGMQVSKYMRWALLGGSGVVYYFLGKSVNVVAYNVFFRSDKYLVDTAQTEGGLQGEKYGLSDYIVSVSVLTVIWAAAASFLAYFVPYMSGTTVGMGDAAGTLIYSTISYMAMVQPANLALIDYLGTSV
ncbi:hypothetical protein FGO68_gene6327 [Halteria grandinella]|uniref:Uncharacterized protein n=1 Tax=Halteria grandinella TaxID=5974 RepID=A0A8J8NJ01_HALGN|nr:hypothetical protein FGO68_gene6327 [Halteria grandinella]